MRALFLACCREFISRQVSPAPALISQRPRRASFHCARTVEAANLRAGWRHLNALKKQAPNREGSRDLMVALVMVWLFLFPFCRFVYLIEGVRNLVEKH